jgi:hypothetical protein
LKPPDEFPHPTCRPAGSGQKGQRKQAKEELFLFRFSFVLFLLFCLRTDPFFETAARLKAGVEKFSLSPHNLCRTPAQAGCGRSTLDTEPAAVSLALEDFPL